MMMWPNDVINFLMRCRMKSDIHTGIFMCACVAAETGQTLPFTSVNHARVYICIYVEHNSHRTKRECCNV